MPLIPVLTRNPSYPQRTHVREKAHWDKVVADTAAQLAAARKRLQDKADQPDLQKTLFQMQGALDQIEDCARRLPGETGELYEEDHHRLDQAVASFSRLASQLA